MKEHRRRPADTIFIVGWAARRGVMWEERGAERSEERYISLECSGASGGRGVNKDR